MLARYARHLEHASEAKAAECREAFEIYSDFYKAHEDDDEVEAVEGVQKVVARMQTKELDAELAGERDDEKVIGIHEKFRHVFRHDVRLVDALRAFSFPATITPATCSAILRVATLQVGERHIAYR